MKSRSTTLESCFRRNSEANCHCLDEQKYVAFTYGPYSSLTRRLRHRPSPLQLKAVHVETFGKTGCRRIVPGQYLAADPQGRAIMISAVEKQKLVSSGIRV